MALFDRLRHGPIRERNDEGTLCGSGYQWDEQRLSRQFASAAAPAAGVIVGIGIVPQHPALGFLALVFGLALLTAVFHRRVRERVVIFLRDGEISTPHGTPQRFFRSRLSFNHDAIASIELTSDCEGFGVMLFTTEGQSVLLSQRMHKADARFVAVQLSKALREMRESLSTLSSRQHHASDVAWVH